MQLGNAERRDTFHEATEELVEGRSLGIQVHEDEFFPSIHLDWEQPILLALKTIHSVKFGHTFERSIQAIVPSMIGTTKEGCLSARLRDHFCRVMPADVEKRAQDTVVAANYNDRFSGNVSRNELPGLFDLLDTTDQLPGFAENRLGLQVGNSSIDVPRRRDGRCFRKRRSIVVSS